MVLFEYYFNLSELRNNHPLIDDYALISTIILKKKKKLPPTYYIDKKIQKKNKNRYSIGNDALFIC